MSNALSCQAKMVCLCWACCYGNTICKCDGWNRLFHFSVSRILEIVHGNVFNVARFPPFLIEVFGCFIVKYQCKINYTTEEAGQLKMCLSKISVYGNMFDHNYASLVFLWSTQVVCPCDIHKVSRFLYWKEGTVEKRNSVRRNDDKFWIWPQCIKLFHQSLMIASVSLKILNFIVFGIRFFVF